jgi:methyl-accepting chemotaxis protein
MAQELRQAQGRLDDAIEHLNDGLVIWDKDDRLVVCNQRFKALYPTMADLNVPGRAFEDVIRGAIARGLFPEAVGNEAEWIAQRIARHRAANSTRIHQLQNGRWVRVSEQRTAEGGIVALHADVSEQKNAELELQQAHDHLKSGSQALAAIVEQAVSGVGAIRESTAALAGGATELSTRTETQVSSLEEMAASIRQLAATVHSNAENAQQASRLAAEARNAADGGSGVVGAAVSAMAQIEESSRRVSEVVGLIEEIAFQTNLLALNAAVEAARAGDAGRGFAVVASEVRALAEKAARASRDVKSLIAGSNSQVRQGADLVRQAGDTLSTIVASVKRVAEIVESIAAASREQSAGVQQVDQAVSDVEGVANKNSELVVETTAALTAVDRQLEDLLTVINAARPAAGADASNSGLERSRARASA